MYKTQFKKHSPYESWTTYGSYSSEAQAVNAAISKKNGGSIMVRVINKQKSIVYVG